MVMAVKISKELQCPLLFLLGFYHLAKAVCIKVLFNSFRDPL
jgi:hypothetical protein